MDPLLGSGIITLAIVVWIVCAVYAYQNAPRRGRRAGLWGVLALIVGPLALFALFLLKPLNGRR